MKQKIGALLVVALVWGMTSCYTTSVPKPEKLIDKDKFIKIMVDMYLTQAINTTSVPEDSVKTITSTDLYFSVLSKHEVADSVFVRSLIYYSSFPKEYEKMHAKMMNILNEAELQFKPKEKLDMGAE
jgi:hypothetical protein